MTLRFDGSPARLVVPWEAVVAFFDPTAEFGLRFDLPALAGTAAPASLTPASGEGDEQDGAKVLSFGRPRDRRSGD